MSYPVGRTNNNNNNNVEPEELLPVALAASERPIDRFEEIFRFLGKALKCIREFQLGIIPVQRSYEQIAADIRELRSNSTASGDRVRETASRVEELINTKLEPGDKNHGYVKLDSIYTHLRELFLVELSAISPSEKASPSISAPQSLCNFLGLLSDDPLLKDRFEQLSPLFRVALNSKMRIFFEQSLGRLKRQFNPSEKMPECFICYNLDDKDVVKWLNEVLAPDLNAFSVTPIFSKEDVSPGEGLTPFQASAAERDFAIVLCTPGLFKKFREKPDSGVADEIMHMNKRPERQKRRAIPILLKKEEGKDPNDVNPFKEDPENPLAVLAPMNNYAAMLELFAILGDHGQRGKSRKLAGDGINAIKRETQNALEELLAQQNGVFREAFEECSRNLGFKEDCPVSFISDGLSFTNRWITEYLEPDLKKLRVIPKVIQKSVFGRVQSPGVETTDKGGSINSIQPPLSVAQPRELSIPPKNRFLNHLGYIPKGCKNVFQIKSDSQRIFFSGENMNFTFPIEANEEYFLSVLKMFAYVRGIEFCDIETEFLKRKNKKLQAAADKFANTERNAQFTLTNLEAIKMKMTMLVAQAKENKPETISQNLISFYDSSAKIALRKNELNYAKKYLEYAEKWSRCKYTADHPDAIGYLRQLADVYYELGMKEEAIVAFTDLNKNGNDMYAYNCLARLYSMSQEFPQAEGCFLNAITLWEGDFGLRVDYGNFLRQDGRYDEAKACLNSVTYAHDDHSWVSYCSTDKNNLPAEMEQLFNSHKKITVPTRQFAFYLRILLEEGDSALDLCRQFEEIVLLKPTAFGYTLLGLSYRRLGAVQEAKMAFSKAL